LTFVVALPVCLFFPNCPPEFLQLYDFAFSPFLIADFSPPASPNSSPFKTCLPWSPPVKLLLFLREDPCIPLASPFSSSNFFLNRAYSAITDLSFISALSPLPCSSYRAYEAKTIPPTSYSLKRICNFAPNYLFRAERFFFVN